jgi:hypothetical protein
MADSTSLSDERMDSRASDVQKSDPPVIATAARSLGSKDTVTAFLLAVLADGPLRAREIERMATVEGLLAAADSRLPLVRNEVPVEVPLAVPTAPTRNAQALAPADQAPALGSIRRPRWHQARTPRLKWATRSRSKSPGRADGADPECSGAGTRGPGASPRQHQAPSVASGAHPAAKVTRGPGASAGYLGTGHLQIRRGFYRYGRQHEPFR